MASSSKIEWTDATWNPIVGCSVVSPGCTNCYAMRQAHRIEAMTAELVHHGKGGAPQYNGTTKIVNGNAVWTGKIGFASNEVLLAPLRRKKPTTYFVNSMSDLFHESVPDEWIDKVFAVMALTPQHTYQILTKRSARMRQWFSADRADSVGLAMLTIVDRIPHGHRRVPWPLSNVWLGVSTERQKEADERIPDLLATPAAVRFISAEPLLEQIDLRNHRVCDQCGNTPYKLFSGDPLCPQPMPIHDAFQCPLHWWPSDGCDGVLKTGIDWVIVGGESGPGARPMHPDWARSIRDQCAAAGVLFFFKQWGTNIPDEEREGRYRRVPKRIAGRLLDGVEHNGFPGGQHANQ